MQTLERDADKEASGPLAIIQAVINTRYSRTRPDEWNSPEQVHLSALIATPHLIAWLSTNSSYIPCRPEA